MMDLPPGKDPKGGSPRSPPRGIPVREYQRLQPDPPKISDAHLPDHVPSIWRAAALLLLTANISGIGSWLMFGLGTVKHSEIEQIMATRAPYIHDRQRIQEFIDDTKRRLNYLEERERAPK